MSPDELAAPARPLQHPSIGVFVWRLRPYCVTATPAFCLEEVGPYCYTFSALGNDAPLYIKPEPEVGPTDIAEERNLPAPVRAALRTAS